MSSAQPASAGNDMDTGIGQRIRQAREALEWSEEDLAHRLGVTPETVRFIEQRVIAMIDIWGVQAFEDLPLPNRETLDEDEDLLNGPQLENQGISQADIDALFD